MSHKVTDEVCKSCGHPGGMHSDGCNTHTGECVFEIDDGKVGKINFCKCREYIKK